MKCYEPGVDYRAGGIGRIVTHKRAQAAEVFSDIWLASRTLAKCDRIAGEIADRRIHTAQVDADNTAELVSLIRKIKPRMVIIDTVDIVERGGMQIALLDTSATAHMPDVLEMPYRAEVRGADHPTAKPHPYRLGGVTCLAGDIIGDYAFDNPLQVGERIIFEDMIHYTMVKTTLFNGIAHPTIAIQHENGRIEIVKQFNYADYEARLS
ncbi:MAG: saccharopine dehydrogenase NADP-binding domain-containing protein [Candidatus Thiodiazotropha sp. (ex Dulcina madagascariensis)]|nr:saccharopine dehydrogenase NADP-binding domain-containing protein [Candidatus Thiodiazotropha sp. (ex Dulcina madagascariensis)]MCU7928352.1 saccharopine dehydrogenase NADP-binding domain-containing protein [Candidatus Thiodiazotropha sp. (ex Dulcina madagascariensis)]